MLGELKQEQQLIISSISSPSHCCPVGFFSIISSATGFVLGYVQAKSNNLLVFKYW